MKKLFLIVLGLVSFNVNADPTYDATRGALQNNSALCSYGYNPNCSSGSRSAPPPKKIIYHDVKVPSKFGAVAMNMKTGDAPGVLNKNSLSEAKKEALAECRKGDRNAPCKVVSWVRNGCIAAAKGQLIKNPKLWGTFYAAEEQGLAEAEALRQCRADPKVTNCEIALPEGCSLPQLQ